MDTSARDRRIRIGAGLIMVGLAATSVIIVFASAPDPRTEVVPIIVACGQALLTFGLGAWLASGRRGTADLVPVPGIWRRIFLLITLLLGVLQFAWQSIADPRHLVLAAFWPNLVGIGIVLQFGPGRHHFQSEEQWITALSRQDTVHALTRVFGQPGLTTKVTGSDVWVEISREWEGDWRHRDAAKHLKVRPHIRFVIDATNDGTRVTAFSREIQLGAYDVLKLSEEMSESGVALARRATAST
ncbi:hypothetical protein [Arthrobacter sp. NPDC056493]|uniref:hypothetical protein n=1 Tax=Arthrobacter sp. NPDC056493 TaxID=3345839 RepID=UPI0036715138